MVSAVFPFPRRSGQQQRVYYKLRALHERFDVTFLGIDSGRIEDESVARLEELCERVVLLPSRYDRGPLRKACYRLAGTVYRAASGLKLSNYLVGRLELTPERVMSAVGEDHFELALFEYWHAWRAAKALAAVGTRTVLDMHDVLWRSLDRQLLASARPAWLRRRKVRRYRRREEAAWRVFDLLIAINAAEGEDVRAVLGQDAALVIAPMGTDLSDWPLSWEPQSAPRVAYYGGLSNPLRAQDALRCAHDIMPIVWREVPTAELWLIGADPTEELRSLARVEPRVTVTGTLDRVQETLARSSILLCPWTGTFGFRSRLIEAMALGVPVVASPDATWGMELVNGAGIFLEATDEGLAQAVIRLLEDRDLAGQQSRLARAEIEAKFSYEATYGELARELESYAATSR